MSSHTVSPNFQSAVAYLSSYSGATSNTTKLELYGLYKYLTVSPTPTTSRPGILDFAGRAKWDAWSQAGKIYKTCQDAESRYIKIASGFGWTEGTVIAKTPGKSTGPSAEEDIWDSDSEAERSSGGDGLGLFVSTMSRPEEASDSSLHGAAVQGDVARVKQLLKNSGQDVNKFNDDGYTPLHLASDRGHLEIVKLLLATGADRNIPDADEFTPLQLAEIAGREDVVAALLATP
ncbi:ankyrin [Coprinopsis marcescibilis]|uniref:Ankyrin n=1 Tax=Coprinopsis marcescibilis TaxID=230819 RepID=A0A5C3LNR7_COPMA|nr:ankyrin [Coprinopsis marcescibilis]